MYLTWYLVGASIMAILGALVFQTKNRSPWKGALLCFLLGLIGLLIAACLNKRPVNAES